MEAHLWYVLPDEVKSVSLLNEYTDLLSPSELENVNQFRGDQLKKRALLARVLVRTTIAKYQINSQVNPRSLKFRKNVHGKPEIEWPNDGDIGSPLLQFNLSHTSSMIACGVTLNAPIGIDVEEQQRCIKSSVPAFAGRYFSSREIERLSSIGDPEVQRHEFVKLWTLKEAYVKALGRGFSDMPFNTFSIWSKARKRGDFLLAGNLLSKESEIMIESSDANTPTSNWQLVLLELAGHYASICVGKDETVGGEDNSPMRLTVWKTIPGVEDLCVSRTDAVQLIGGIGIIK